MRVFLGVSLYLLLFSQEEGRPGDQSALKAHTGPICHQRLALAAHSSSVCMICETRGLYLVVPFKGILENSSVSSVCIRLCLWVCKPCHTFAALGRRRFSAGGLVKHESFLSLKEKLCSNQSLFAPAVICLRTSAGANKHVRTARLQKNKIGPRLN